MTGTGVVGIKRHRSSEEKDVAKDAAVGSTGVRSRLVLAGAHPHSLRLARSCASIDDAELRTWSCDVRSLRVVRPGTVEARIRLPAPADEDADADPRYVGEWRLLIGGEGLGDDPETAAVIGTLPRAPIAARFACPYLSMPGVDDCGFVDESFFVALGDAPTLRDVCERAAEWLEGRHVRDEGGARGGGGGDDALNGGGGDERSKPPSPTTFSASSPLRVAWLDAAAHTRRKSDVIDAFRAASASSSFASAIRTDATFASDWFVPAFRPLVDAARRGDDAETLRVAREFAASFVAEAAPGSGVFSFDLLEPSATSLLTACVDAYERSGFPRRRPNTMNDAGAVVNASSMRFARLPRHPRSRPRYEPTRRSRAIGSFPRFVRSSTRRDAATTPRRFASLASSRRRSSRRRRPVRASFRSTFSNLPRRVFSRRAWTRTNVRGFRVGGPTR